MECKFTVQIMGEKVYSFIGDFDSRADAKNRIVLPAAFKHELEGAESVRLVIRKDIFEQCLNIYPYPVWEHMMTDLRSRLNPYDRRHAQFMREQQRSTCEASLDANGRLLVPQRLLDLIGASKELTLLGVDDHIEMWDKEAFASQAISGEELGALAEGLFANGGDLTTQNIR